MVVETDESLGATHLTPHRTTADTLAAAGRGFTASSNRLAVAA